MRCKIVTDAVLKEKLSLFIPGYFTYRSRTPSIPIFMGVYFIYPVSILLSFIELLYLIDNGINQYFSHIFLEHLFLYLLYYFCFFTIYEIGYIFNDAISVKSENHPKKRLSPSLNRALVYCSTIFRILLFVLLYFLFNSYLEPNQGYTFILINTFLIIVYYVHNSIPKPFRIFTIFYLRLMRSIYPLLYFMLTDTKILTLALIYGIVFAAYNVITYIVINYDSFYLKSDEMIKKLYYNPRFRTIFFVTNIAVIVIFMEIMYPQNISKSLFFICYASMFFVMMSYGISKTRYKKKYDKNTESSTYYKFV